MKKLGKIETSHVCDEFRAEIEFSKYLGDNLDILGEKLGIDLSGISTLTEAPVGRFRCDIVGFLEEKGVIAIENQLGTSSHDHLGKLLVYFSNQDAKIGV